MTAHKSPIKALAMSKYRVDCTGEDEQQTETTETANEPSVYLMESLVSVDETGELAVWNCHDGRCLLHNLRATATGKNAGYPNSISISPNYEFCVLGGYSDKLVILRLSTLEIVQIVEVSGGKIPRWVRTAGFLLQDDPNLLLDYLTLNFNVPAGESLTARQFDPKIGKFVSPACPILPPTIPSAQLEEFSTCHLLTCSRANPGLAALVTKLRHVWLIDFLSGDFVQFSLDFEIDGVEFVRADLLLVWSKTGKLAFYNVFIQSSKMDDPADLIKRSRSPILGHVVRKLDIKCSFAIGNRLHLKLLATHSEPNACASLCWIETIQCPQRRTQVSIVQVEFDSECPDRTVNLYRQQDLALQLLFNETLVKQQPHSSEALAPVTCTITTEPNWLIQGHVDGRISRKSVIDFFTDSTDVICTPSLEDLQPNFSSYPVTCLLSVIQDPHSLIVAAGDSQGQIQFWQSTENDFKFLGASRCHIKKIIGIVESGGVFYSWSVDGVVAMYAADAKDEGAEHTVYRCIHLFYPPASNLGLTGLYWRNSPEGSRCLLLDYRTTNSSTTIIHSNWDLTTGQKLSDLTDSAYLETLSVSDLKVQVEGLTEGLTGKALHAYRSPENSQLFDGVVSVLGAGRQWPELPCHTLMIDIRLLAHKLKTTNSPLTSQLAKRIVSQFLAWGLSERMDAICRDALSLSPNSESIRYGLLGANGNISIILNPPCKDRFWTLSPTLTASLQLAIIVLLGSLGLPAEQQQEICSLVSFYSAQIGDIPGSTAQLNTFRPAALSFISKFWQDSDEEIQKAARILFSTTFARLSLPQRSSLISYWKDYRKTDFIIVIISIKLFVVPNSSNNGSDGRSMYRSAIILGIIGVQEPESLSRSIKKHVAESLVALLLDGKRNIFRLAAVELMGRGYSIWLPFIHGASIFKLLHSWLIQLHGGDEQFYQTTLKAVIHILTTEATASTNANTSVSSNLSDSMSTLSVSTTQSSTQISRKSSSSALNNAPTRPLITWLNELLAGLQGSREVSPVERKCSVELIKSLLSFKPVIFQGHEHLLVEVSLKLISNDMKLYRELTAHFGVISLHQGAQKLAVAQADNSIAVYDLKTGGRVSLLQGHVHPCTLVAFNPDRTDGKQLLSYSAAEACVRWWHLSSSSSTGTGSSISGLFSSFTHSAIESSGSESSRPGLNPVKILIVQPELTEAIDCIPSGSVFKLNPINLNWTGKLVEFRVGSSLIQTLSIP